MSTDKPMVAERKGLTESESLWRNGYEAGYRAAKSDLQSKWSNIAAICNLSDEQWTAIKKPPRKHRTRQKKEAA